VHAVLGSKFIVYYVVAIFIIYMLLLPRKHKLLFIALY